MVVESARRAPATACQRAGHHVGQRPAPWRQPGAFAMTKGASSRPRRDVSGTSPLGWAIEAPTDVRIRVVGAWDTALRLSRHGLTWRDAWMRTEALVQT